jgi:hypothetical protein
MYLLLRFDDAGPRAWSRQALACGPPSRAPGYHPIITVGSPDGNARSAGTSRARAPFPHRRAPGPPGGRRRSCRYALSLAPLPTRDLPSHPPRARRESRRTRQGVTFVVHYSCPWGSFRLPVVMGRGEAATSPGPAFVTPRPGPPPPPGPRPPLPPSPQSRGPGRYTPTANAPHPPASHRG